MAIQTYRGRGFSSPNVSLASGEMYPNGVDVSPANPDVQRTVRPGGWMFKPSPGYPTIRVGVHKLDMAHPQGQSIHFTPVRLAEDVQPAHDTRSGPPVMVDAANASKTADIADLPGSEYLDGEGRLPAYMAEQNRGPYLMDSQGHVTAGDVPRHGGNTALDMGDRDPERFLTRRFYDRLLVNPNAVLKENFRDDPVITSIWAILVVGAGGLLVGNIERAFQGRNRGRGVAAAATSVPAAAASGTGATVADVAGAANESLTAAGSAVQAAVSAAGDAVEAAGEAVEATTEAVASAGEAT